MVHLVQEGWPSGQYIYRAFSGIKSEEAVILHVLFVIAVLPAFIYFAFVALLVFVTELIK